MTGSDPAGGSACENTHAPTPSLGRPRAGSLPFRSARPDVPRRPGSTGRNRNYHKESRVMPL